VRVTVEGLIAGVGGSIPLGLGLSDATAQPTVWLTRVGVSDAVRPGGAFAGLLEASDDSYVRAELLDTDGNLSVARELESTLLGNGRLLLPASVPVLASPADGGNSGGASFDVLFDNTIRDLQAVGGLYRVSLQDSAGRGWTLWRPDPGDAVGQIRVAVPSLVGAGSSGLADGAIDVRIASVGAPGLDLGDFLWSDLERLYTVLSSSEPFQFSQP
jgi:hypothetical protein